MSDQKKKNSQISILFAASDYELLKQIAEKNDRSLSAQVRLFVKKGLHEARQQKPA